MQAFPDVRERVPSSSSEQSSISSTFMVILKQQLHFLAGDNLFTRLMMMISSPEPIRRLQN
jgi:hypothetical protein